MSIAAARPGHKTEAHGFDGCKGHLALDPDAEPVTATAVAAGNAGDDSVAVDLLAHALAPDGERPTAAPLIL